MPTTQTFGGRQIIEPGAYSQIKSGINNAPDVASFGNVMIIDTGTGAGFGGGSGINGTIASKKSSIYSFNTIQEFRSFVRGGKLWDIAEYLFSPVSNAQGPQKVFLVRAATTVAATITYTLTNGAFTVRCKNEGTGGNGVSASGNLSRGYGAIMKAGIVDSAKFIIEFYEGTFKGLDADNDPYDSIADTAARPLLIARSVEFNTIAGIVNWLKSDYALNQRFEVSANSGSGAVTSGDLAANNTIKLAAGGTETYGSTDYDDVLSSIKEVDNTFFLCDRTNSNATGTENTKLLAHINTESEFKKFMFVGGGNDVSQFTSVSVAAAQYFDSVYALVVHSGFKVKIPFTTTTKTKDSFYMAAMICGRLAGLQPQTNGTWKTVRQQIIVSHDMLQSEREIALKAGVLHLRNVTNIGLCINQAINTLQKNSNLINADGTSSELSIMRIGEQLNKELVLNMRPLFIGGNLNTASPADVKAWIEGYLTFKTATRTEDNLIIRFEKVSVIQKQDYYEITYGFVPNGPLNKLFVTGFMLDANLSA